MSTDKYIPEFMMPYTVEFIKLKPLSQLIIINIISKGNTTKDSIINKLNEKHKKLGEIVNPNCNEIKTIDNIDNLPGTYECINNAIEESIIFLQGIELNKYEIINKTLDKDIFHANLILNKYIKDAKLIKEDMDKIIFTGWQDKYKEFNLYKNVIGYFTIMYSVISKIKFNSELLNSNPLQLIQPESLKPVLQQPVVQPVPKPQVVQSVPKPPVAQPPKPIEQVINTLKFDQYQILKPYENDFNKYNDDVKKDILLRGKKLKDINIEDINIEDINSIKANIKNIMENIAIDQSTITQDPNTTKFDDLNKVYEFYYQIIKRLK